ncbi:UNKNOWN [Stylonychia lemnae]|uniref:TOG domain-containing protein n=1 Tax=Stylonychia lemnae TaxID=5949 RepID=A0A078A469_STYLE|nr:UNKNOWN [Stylonychia lemnae]|eukprot:CDW76684.1 UNKNOWN [Stylonychia lemnae]
MADFRQYSFVDLDSQNFPQIDCKFRRSEVQDRDNRQRKNPSKELKARVLSTSKLSTSQLTQRSKSSIGNYNHHNKSTDINNENILIKNVRQIPDFQYQSPGLFDSQNTKSEIGRKSTQIDSEFKLLSNDLNMVDHTPFNDKTNMAFQQADYLSPFIQEKFSYLTSFEDKISNIEIPIELSTQNASSQKPIFNKTMFWLDKENNNNAEVQQEEDITPSFNEKPLKEQKNKKQVNLTKKLQKLANDQQTVNNMSQGQLHRDKSKSTQKNSKKLIKLSELQALSNQLSNDMGILVYRREEKKEKDFLDDSLKPSSKSSQKQKKPKSERTCSTPPPQKHMKSKSAQQTKRQKPPNQQNQLFENVKPSDFSQNERQVNRSDNKSSQFYGNLMNMMYKQIQGNQPNNQGLSSLNLSESQKSSSLQKKKNSNCSSKKKAPFKNITESTILQQSICLNTQGNSSINHINNHSRFDSMTQIEKLLKQDSCSHIQDRCEKQLLDKLVQSKETKNKVAGGVKVRVNDLLVDLKELLRICNDHCKDCDDFQDKIKTKGIIASSIPPRRPKSSKKENSSNHKNHNDKLQTLKEIRAKIIGKADSVMIGNLKKLILGLKASLTPVQNLIYKNDPDMEIHMVSILPNLVSLFETSNESLREQNLNCIKLYCKYTGNIDHIYDTNVSSMFQRQLDMDMIDKLREQQSLKRAQVTDILSIQQDIQSKSEAITSQFQGYSFDAVPQISNLFAFGSLPYNMIQHIQQHSEWKMKLKVVEDLEKFMVEMSNQQKQQFMNYCSSFITFVEQFLIQDDNMKIVLSGIRILRYLMRNAQMAEKTNLTKLIHSLIMKMNDPKEIIRAEIESLFVQLSYHMKTKSLILNLLHLFKTYRISNDAKESLLRSIITIILTQDGSQINDLQISSSFKEENLYMQIIEPLAYLFTNKEEPLKVRYMAQETMAVIASILNRTQVLEALYECLSDDKSLYDKFCDRLDADLIPFLSKMNDIQKLEFPLPITHVFSIQVDKKTPIQKRERNIQAADQYYSQDFTDNISENDFQPYNQAIKQRQPYKIMNQVKAQNNVTSDTEDYVVTKKLEQKMEMKSRRVFQGLGQNIVGNNIPSDDYTQLMNDKKPDSRNPTPHLISEQLRLLKSKDRFNSPPNGTRLNTKGDYDQTLMQENSTQSSFNNQTALKNTLADKSQNQTVQIQSRENTATKSNRGNKQSPKFYAKNMQQEVDYMDQTPKMYSNKFPGKVEYQTIGSPNKVVTRCSQRLKEQHKIQWLEFRNLKCQSLQQDHFVSFEELGPSENPQKDILTVQTQLDAPSLIKLCESLRSSLSKHAINLVEEAYNQNSKLMEIETEQILNMLFKRSADTNKLGKKILTLKDTDKIITMLGGYVNDSSPEVRQNTKQAILLLENGADPITREDSERLFKKYVTKEFDQQKVLKILDQGMQGMNLEGLINQSQDQNVYNQTGISRTSNRMRSQASFKSNINAQSSPMIDKSPSKKENFRKAFKPELPGNINIVSETNSQIGSSENLSQQKIASNQSQRDIPAKSPLIKKNAQTQQNNSPPQIEKPTNLTTSANNLANQPQEEITQILQLLLKQQTDQRKYALLNLADVSLKQKQLLIQNELFYQAFDKVIMTPLLTIQPQATAKSMISANLLEAEVLHNIISEVSDRLDFQTLRKTVNSVSIYLGSSNSQAKKNAENLLNKIISIYPPGEIVGGYAESIQNSGNKAKVYLTNKLIEMVPIINKQSPAKLPTEVFTHVYRLMDDYIAGRGRNIPNDLKVNIEQLIKVIYYEQGSAFVEQCPSNKLSKIFEIVNKEKKQLI